MFPSSQTTARSPSNQPSSQLSSRPRLSSQQPSLRPVTQPVTSSVHHNHRCVSRYSFQESHSPHQSRRCNHPRPRDNLHHFPPASTVRNSAKCIRVNPVVVSVKPRCSPALTICASAQPILQPSLIRVHSLVQPSSQLTNVV